MSAHHHHPVPGNAQRAALIGSITANSVLLAVQVVAGFTLGSLALLADSLHNASDVVALGVALVGAVLARRAPSARASFGLVRAEILAALVNAVVLIGLSVWVGFEAFGRFSEPSSLAPGPLVAIGLLGLLVNGLSARWVARTAAGNLNMRGAFWHLVADAAGSAGVVVAGVAVFFWDATWVDPAMSLVIAAMVVVGVLRLVYDTVSVLLELTPRGVDPAEVTAALAGLNGVSSAHHLHMWSVDSSTVALTAHLVMDTGVGLHEAQQVAAAARVMLSEKFGVTHVTLEPECHGCDTPQH